MIRSYMASRDWRRAISTAARLPRLGQHRNAILDAHNAFVRPDWARSLGKGPEALITAGIKALRERFAA